MLFLPGLTHAHTHNKQQNTFQAYTCTIADGAGCQTCEDQSDQTADGHCASCNGGYQLTGTACKAYRFVRFVFLLCALGVFLNRSLVVNGGESCSLNKVRIMNLSARRPSLPELTASGWHCLFFLIGANTHTQRK